MSVSTDALRELHRLHQQLADLKSRLERGPRQVKLAQQAVQRSETELAQAKEAWKTTRMQSDDQQRQLKEREDKIKKLQTALNESRDNKEYRVLKDQIAAEKQANSVLEDEILDKLEKLDRLQEDIQRAEQRVAKTRAELEKIETRVRGEQDKLQSELDRVTADLKQVEQGLPHDFKQDYDRLIRAHGEEGLAPVEDESCSGCHSILSPQTMNELYMGKMVFCKSCGCLLYLAEDRSPT